MHEMLRFLESERKVLKKLPALTAQQAVNQPRGSIPEMLGLLELVSEPNGKVRNGKMSARAKAVEEETSRAKRKLHLYSPIAGYRALPGGAPPSKARIETVKEDEDVDGEPGSRGSSSDVQVHESGGSRVEKSGREAAPPDGGGGDEMAVDDSTEHADDRFHRPDRGLPMEEDGAGEEEENRYAVWIEHVNKESLMRMHKDKRMGIAFMHVAMSSDEVCGYVLQARCPQPP